MRYWQVTDGALSYEFNMQVRRWPMWIAMLGTAGFTFYAYLINDQNNLYSLPARDATIHWANFFNLLLPAGFGVILADRLIRDQRVKVNELFFALPGSSSARLLGGYLGSTLATIIPVVLVYAAGVSYIFFRLGDPEAFWVALLAFAAVNLPGLLFVGAFSVGLPLIIWLPLYQFLFVGYWFWGNALPASVGIPTLSRTLLTPLGEYRTSGFFGESDGPFHTNLEGAVISTVLMLGLSALALLVTARYQTWRQARR
jgi:hypothetical protein